MGSLFVPTGGQSVAAPNPTWANNAARGQAAGENSADAIYNNTTAAQPGLQAETDYGINAAHTGYNQVQNYNNYVGGQRDQYGLLQDRAMNDASNFNNADFRERYAQGAGEQVAGQVQKGDQNLQRAMAARGINANSGAYLSALNDNQIQGAMGQANAQNMAREAARMEGLRLNDRAAGMVNQGASTFGNLGYQGAQAGIAAGAAGLSTASAGLNARNAGYTAAGTLGSGGSNAATGMYGANAKYNADNAAQQLNYGQGLGSSFMGAAGQVMDGFGGGVGSVAGAAGDATLWDGAGEVAGEAIMFA